MRRFGMTLAIGLGALTACGGDTPSFDTALVVEASQPGDVIALRATGSDIEFVNRRAGEILRFRTDPDAADADTADADTADASSNGVDVLAVIDVSTEGEQRGLLGQTVVDGRRYAAWTDPDTLDLVVGDVSSGGVDRIVWAGTGTESKAIGGHLETREGLLVLGIGSLTDWGRNNGSGAIVTLDPDGAAEQEPQVISGGWNNPFAFTVLADGTIWVADNAPDGSDLPVAERDGERIALAAGEQKTGGPSGITEPPPQRAPSAIVQLPDGRLGVCGFLDNEMRAYDITEAGESGESGEPGEVGAGGRNLERAGTIGPCLSGATVLDDGSIVTSSLDDDGTPALLIRSP